jgi:hypothetical protein
MEGAQPAKGAPEKGLPATNLQQTKAICCD